MRKQRMPDFFAETPDGFHNRMKGTLSALEAGRHNRGGQRRYKASLVLAAVLVIALGTVAFAAAQSGVLDFLFKGKTLSPEAQQLLIEPNESVECDGIRLTLDGYLNDGVTVSLAYTVESTLDTPVIIGTGAVFGYDAAKDPEPDSFDTLYVLGDTSNHALPRFRQFEQKYTLPIEFDGLPVPVKLYAQVYSTDRQMVWVASGEHNGNAFLEDGSLQVSWSGQIIPMMADDTRKRASQTFDAKRGIGGNAWDVRTWKELGGITDHASITLDTNIKPTIGAQRTQVKGQTVFEFPEYALCIDRLDFTATALFFDVTMRAPGMKDQYDWDWEDEDKLFKRGYVLLDAEGNELITEPRGGTSELFMNPRNANDGVTTYAQSTNCFEQPFDSFPLTITLMPVRDWTAQRDYQVQKEPLTDEQFLARNREHYIPEEAVTVHLERFDSRDIAHTRPDGQTVFAQEGQTVTVKTLDFLKDRTVCVWEIVYDELLNYNEQTHIGDGYILILPDGTEVLRRDAEGRVGNTVYGPHSKLPDGRDKLTLRADFDPVGEIPAEVTLMPMQFPFKHPYIKDGKTGEDGMYDERTLEEDNAISRRYFKTEEAVTVKVARQ